jgi:hypothetical protein
MLLITLLLLWQRIHLNNRDHLCPSVAFVFLAQKVVGLHNICTYT